jgi:hypothetical protein
MSNDGKNAVVAALCRLAPDRGTRSRRLVRPDYLPVAVALDQRWPSDGPILRLTGALMFVKARRRNKLLSVKPLQSR